jgi:hypothetical protein
MLSSFKSAFESVSKLLRTPGSRKQQAASAQAALRSKLEAVLGPDLPGITGFGAGLDYDTRQRALNVLVDSEATAKHVRSKLPEQIRGLPVRISKRARAVFD